MPAQSLRQQRFMNAELGRKKLGRPTKTGMSDAKLKDFTKPPPGKKLAKMKGAPKFDLDLKVKQPKFGGRY